MAWAYRTTPNDALYVLLGIPPVHLAVQKVFMKYNFLHNGKNFENKYGLNIANIDGRVLIGSVPRLERRYISVKKIANPDYEIFTDGSGMDGSVAAAFCVFKNKRMVQIHQYKLRSVNSVFQAELLAIRKAVEWLADSASTANIFTDSASSISALASIKNKTRIVLDTVKVLNENRKRFGLEWTRAHVGTRGNELADLAAKEALIKGFPVFDHPAPLSLLTRAVKETMLGDWQILWDASGTGRRTYDRIPKVSLKNFANSRYLIYYYTGHGPFLSYLERFKVVASPLCVCGAPGDPDHYLFRCPDTKKFWLSETKMAGVPGLEFFQKDKANFDRLVNCFKIAEKITKTITDSL